MNYSTNQLSIFEAIRSETSSLLIEGVAGCGKTTTIEHSIQHIPSAMSKLIVFTAFNKRIADELEKRLPPFVQCGTFHKRALSSLSRSLPKRPKIDGDKVFNLLKTKLKGRQEFEIYAKFCLRLVGLAKNSGVGLTLLDSLVPNTSETFWSIIQHNNLSLDSLEGNTDHAIDLAMWAFDESLQDISSIDFDDMLYLAIAKRTRFDLASYLYIDETQDTNAIQMELIRMMLAPRGRLIAVGDHNQAIYGFRGAGTDSMDRMADLFSMKRMPLDVCYRCSQSVVDETRKHLRPSQKSVSLITAAENAPLGEVKHLTKYEPSLFHARSAILCRNTAPLIKFAFALIKRRTPCRVLGREIGQGLIALIKKLVDDDFERLEQRLAVYLDRETTKFEARGENAAADAVRDRVDCIFIFINELSENERSIRALCAKITALFDDNASNLVTLSTVHKSKGFEWERVFILDKEKYMPSRYATKPWQIEQEHNLIYVAQTRAKVELYYINSDAWQGATPQVEKPKTLMRQLTDED